MMSVCLHAAARLAGLGAGAGLAGETVYCARGLEQHLARDNLKTGITAN